MNILPLNFQKLLVKLRIKLSEKLEGKCPQVYQEIRVLSKEIRQRLKVHAGFSLSTSVL